MNTLRPIAVGSMAIAAVFHLSSVYADPVRDSFNRDLSRAATPANAKTLAPMTDALQRAVQTTTWTQPEPQALQSHLRDLRRAPTASGATAPFRAEADPMLAHFGRLMQAKAPGMLAQLEPQ